MKTSKMIQVPVFGGGFNTKEEITTDEYRGEKLGSAIPESAKLFVETVAHIERADDTTITFDCGTFRKDLIKFLIWRKDEFSSEVHEVVYAHSSHLN